MNVQYTARPRCQNKATWSSWVTRIVLDHLSIDAEQGVFHFVDRNTPRSQSLQCMYRESQLGLSDYNLDFPYQCH